MKICKNKVDQGESHQVLLWKLLLPLRNKQYCNIIVDAVEGSGQNRASSLKGLPPRD